MRAVKSSPEVGRYTISCESLVPGSVILQEFPFASALSQDQIGIRCHHCWRQEEKLLRCSSCQLVRYCSRDCQRAAWGDHKAECKCMQVSKELKRQPLLQSPTAMMMARVALARTRQANGVRHPQAASFEEFMQMVTHVADMPEALKTTFAHLAATVAGFLEPRDQTTEQSDAPGDPKSEIAKDVFDWVARSTCNAFTVCDEELRPIGVGSYPQAGLINHSCDPNCHVSFRGQLLRILVLKPIAAGEEITINYIEVAQTREDRQEQLKTSYYFTCGCPRCESKTPGALEHAAVRCPNCEGYVTAQRKNTSESLEEEYACSKCAAALQPDQKASLAQSFERVKALSARIKAQPDLHTLQAIRAQLEALVPAESFAMLECLNALSSRAILEQQFELAERFVGLSLTIHVKAFPVIHPLTGLQYATQAKLLSYLGRDQEALQSASKALDILELTHGSDSSVASAMATLKHETQMMLRG